MTYLWYARSGSSATRRFIFWSDMIVLLIIGKIITDLFTVGSVFGLCVLEVSLLDGICMVYDKLVHNENIF
jgi:hypothetical protein